MAKETNRQTINLWQVSHLLLNLTTKTTGGKKDEERNKEKERKREEQMSTPEKTIFQANIYKSEREMRAGKGGQPLEM